MTKPRRHRSRPAEEDGSSRRPSGHERTACASEPPLPGLPPFRDRDAASALLREVFGVVVSPRSLERWPLAWRRFNGRAYCATAELLSLASARLAASLALRSGRRVLEQVEDRAA